MYLNISFKWCYLKEILVLKMNSTYKTRKDKNMRTITFQTDSSANESSLDCFKGTDLFLERACFTFQSIRKEYTFYIPEQFTFRQNGHPIDPKQTIREAYHDTDHITLTVSIQTPVQCINYHEHHIHFNKFDKWMSRPDFGATLYWIHPIKTNDKWAFVCYFISKKDNVLDKKARYFTMEKFTLPDLREPEMDERYEAVLSHINIL